MENVTLLIINSRRAAGRQNWVQDSAVVPADVTSAVPGSPAPSAPRSGTQSIERAVTLLERLGASERSLGLSEIARAVGLNPSTAHRLLRALVVAGYVEQEPMTEQYRLGLGIAVLGQRALEHAGYHVAKPVLDDLSARTGESVSLGIRRADEVVVIEQAVSASPLRFDHPAGAEIAMHASAMGKVLLANSAKSIEREVALLATFDRFTDRTITAPDAVVTELDGDPETGLGDQCRGAPRGGVRDRRSGPGAQRCGPCGDRGAGPERPPDPRSPARTRPARDRRRRRGRRARHPGLSTRCARWAL